MSGTYTKLRYHFVFATKGREPMILPGLKTDLYAYMAGIIRRQKGVALEINGMPDHVHILAGMPPTLSVAEIMKRIKGATSYWINDQGRLDRHFAWRPGYGAFTVSESQVAKVRRYIRNQEEHHRNQSFDDEMALLLERHGLDPEPPRR